MSSHYTVTISTSSDYAEAGTLSRVQMRIVAEGGNMSEWITLNSFLPDLIDVGENRTYKLQTPDHGKPILIELKLLGQTNDPWYCNEVEIRHHSKTYTFPVYDWVDSSVMTVTDGKGCLPQNVDNEQVLERRRAEIERNHSIFAWMPKPDTSHISYGIPRHIQATTVDELPLLFKWNNIRADNFAQGSSIAKDLAARNIQGAQNFPLNSLESFQKVYAGLADSQPPFLNIWDTDREFGRQLLNGMTPSMLERCNEFPSYCNINEAACALPSGVCLEEEMKAGRIYISDFKPTTEGVPFNPNPTTRQPLFAPQAIALFHATRDGSFNPIAIQLTPNDPESIFSPNDSKDDWLLAKMYYQSAKTSVHEWIYHYLRAHAVTESLGIATFRNFPRSHPLYKLLRPHLRTAAHVNTIGRKTLVPPLSPANLSVALPAAQLVQKSFRDFDFSLLDIPKLFADRGIDDEYLLKNYHYRDDALALWDEIENYVDDIIDEFYHNDDDVANDYELQAWCRDIGDEGFGWFDGNRRGMPESIGTVNELNRICTMIIFNATAQHAAVNFGQFEIYQFVPNNPPSMRMPVHKRGEANLQRILASLPDLTISSFAIGLAYSLSQYADNEVYIGEVPRQFFTSKKIKKHEKRFARNLKRLSRRFHRRNRRLEIPYTNLLPERIPNSVAN